MEHDIRQVPAIDAGHLVGLVHLRDIRRWLQLQAPAGLRAKAR